MVVNYKKNGKDIKVTGVSWVDTFMTVKGNNTAVFMKNGEYTTIPLEDLISIVEEKNYSNVHTY